VNEITPPREGTQLDVRKYSNRRYYDATRSCHLTLEEIRSLIRKGYIVKVTDSKTGADITHQVLTQIILELETPKLAALPVSLLTELIRINEQMISQFSEKYFRLPLQAWLEYQKQLEERFRQMQGLQSLYSPFGAWDALARPFSAAAPPVESINPQHSPPNEKDAALTAIAKLQQELSELKQKISPSEGPRRRKRKA